MSEQPAETDQIVTALREAFSGDEFEENAQAAAGEGEWSWFRWLAVSTVESLAKLPLADRDCTAVGFSGEGRCIEPAASNGLCVTHARIEAKR